MVYLSKSRYCQVWQCPKMAWLKKYKPEEEVKAPGLEARFTSGNEVGDLAMGLFGDFVEVTKKKEDGSLDLPAMIDATKAEMARGTAVICEASFSFQGLYCAVDILKKEGDGWAVYEVKSSTHGDKDVYLADVAYQKYVLEHCGVKVTGVYTVVLNNQYVFDGTLDLKQLFKVTDVSELIELESRKVEKNLAVADRVLSCKDEPEIELSMACTEPYACGFFPYCTRNLPKPNVFDLYGMKYATKLRYYKQGILRFENLIDEPKIKNEKVLRQMEFALSDRDVYLDKEQIRAFLDGLTYPLYFLDFETIQPIVPQFVGTRPYQQIPFQYSLHYIETEGGPLLHKEFLAESCPDPRRALAEQLCSDIPENVCTLVYNQGFEKTQLKELAAAFPDLSEHLLNIRDHIADLLVLFRGGAYYTRAMGASFSIKSVLPAMFPNDPALDYHALEGVHNGGEAMTIFPQIQFMTPEDRETTRRNLLKYCELDTLAMVKVWEGLVRLTQWKDIGNGAVKKLERLP